MSNRPTQKASTSRRATARLSARLAALCIAIVQVAPTYAACAGDALPGVNVSGGEFNSGAQPGRYGWDYIYPAAAEIDLMKKLNLKLMRVPFLWERVQYAASTPLVEAEMARLDTVVGLAKANGITVVLDAHNYGMYKGARLDTSGAPPYALPDLWQRIAKRYRNEANVVFDIMNEPNGIAANTWAGIARQTLDAIRASGATNLVMIPGTNWDGAQSWFSPAGTQSNADALLPIGRSDARVVFEVHQYFDGNYSGTSATCTNAGAAAASLANVGKWARTNHVRVFLGEFGVSQRTECVKALDDALAVVQADKDVWYGWTYWAAGAWWGDYMFNVESASGQAAQGSVLKAGATALNNATCRPTKQTQR